MALYESWDLEAMQDADDGAELQSEGYVPATSFTPINRPARQLLTPQSSTFTPIIEPSPQANRGRQRGKRHPAVTEHLGLGMETEPPFLDRYEPALPPTPSSPPRSRKRKKQDGHPPANADSENTKPAKQRCISDGLRATKRVANRTVQKNGPPIASGRAPYVQASSPPSASRNSDMPAPTRVVSRPTESSNKGQRAHTELKAASRKMSLGQPSGRTVVSTVAPDAVACNNAANQHLEFDSQDTMADEEIEDIFNTIDLDNANVSCTTDVKPSEADPMPLHTSEVDFDDEDLFSLTAVPANDTSSPMPRTVVSSDAVEQGTSKSGTLSAGLTQTPCSSASRRRTRKFVSPTTSKSKSIVQKPAVSPVEEQKPIVRPPFPTPVRDRSPIIGLSSNLLLRTCFRIGEAINQANHAAKHGQKILFELYARVLSSQRDETKQDFMFHDLFHAKPPYIKGVYDAVIWKSVRLYNYDSERLLEEGRICRCIGTMKREGKEWVMVVLSAWEAKWEDVAWVEGIVKV